MQDAGWVPGQEDPARCVPLRTGFVALVREGPNVRSMRVSKNPVVLKMNEAAILTHYMFYVLKVLIF